MDKSDEYFSNINRSPCFGRGWLGARVRSAGNTPADTGTSPQSTPQPWWYNGDGVDDYVIGGLHINSGWGNGKLVECQSHYSFTWFRVYYLPESI